VKNITVCVDEAVYHAARVAAAQHRTSVSALVRGYLAVLGSGNAPVLADPGDREDRKQREELVAALKKCRLVLGYKPTRERTYER
jgi:hypothetical protein